MAPFITSAQPIIWVQSSGKLKIINAAAIRSTAPMIFTRISIRMVSRKTNKLTNSSL